MYARLKRIRLPTVVLLVILVLLAGCNSSDAIDPGADEANPDAKEVVLCAQDEGRRLELEIGQILIITLESNPSTGYHWEVVESDWAMLQHKGEAVFQVSDPRNPPPPGAGGTETFRFEAIGIGQMSLTLAYLRPWEEGKDPLETFSIQVVVR